MDAVLGESTYPASCSGTLSGAEAAHATQPHTGWFLRYLDTTAAPGSEPPWVALYASKACLIAWQLVRKGVPGTMQAVGVLDGDAEGGPGVGQGGLPAQGEVAAREVGIGVLRGVGIIE